ncbi:MAG: SDR family NAD(P)-dependent oxidoreductase [Proteobacteria bacterium]|nr:SDR family NAD(P)-dependent oxidoreductase [Pseudomonadota bacterium]
MKKTILLTGATDGIGLEAAKLLMADGHRVLLHGRNPGKLGDTAAEVGGETESYVADLSRLEDVEAMAQAITAKHDRLDVLINNAGILKTPHPVTADGLDIRFMVNTLAPYVLTRRLLPLMNGEGRIVNLSSAAQSSVSIEALAGKTRVSDMEAYSQSKLAITMWTKSLAASLADGPIVVAVNPGSLLASKMVKEGFGIAGKDLSVGAEILFRAAVSDEFTDAAGKYFDNDRGQFGEPHPDADDEAKIQQVMSAMEEVITNLQA